jgi:hypothetical protein
MTTVVVRFEDEVNPTDDEIRRWAYSGAPEPMQDFDIIVADPEHLPTLMSLVADPDCLQRAYLLGSLYCLVGHTDLTDPRLTLALVTARASTDSWLRTWATRADAVVADPASRNRDDWCGWGGYRTRPVDA